MELTKFAMLGEKIACGTPIADNVAAVIFGGFILIRSYEPLDVIKLPVPKDLRLVAIHPQIEIKTVHSRAVLKENIPMELAIKQWGNLAGMISGLYENNYDYYDYSFSSRIRRFHQPMYYYNNYYGGIYTDYYWYNNNPYYWGTSIYYGYNWHYPYYSYYSYLPYYYGNYYSFYSYPHHAYYHSVYNNSIDWKYNRFWRSC